MALRAPAAPFTINGRLSLIQTLQSSLCLMIRVLITRESRCIVLPWALSRLPGRLLSAETLLTPRPRPVTEAVSPPIRVVTLVRSLPTAVPRLPSRPVTAPKWSANVRVLASIDRCDALLAVEAEMFRTEAKNPRNMLARLAPALDSEVLSGAVRPRHVVDLSPSEAVARSRELRQEPQM